MHLVEAFGIVLREKRLRRGLTQESLSQLAGLQRNFIGDIERGNKVASLNSVAAIAEALECRPSDLLISAEHLVLRDDGSRQLL